MFDLPIEDKERKISEHVYVVTEIDRILHVDELDEWKHFQHRNSSELFHIYIILKLVCRHEDSNPVSVFDIEDLVCVLGWGQWSKTFVKYLKYDDPCEQEN